MVLVSLRHSRVDRESFDWVMSLDSLEESPDKYKKIMLLRIMSI